jgi:hypothetical protein
MNVGMQRPIQWIKDPNPINKDPITTYQSLIPMASSAIEGGNAKV